MITFLIETLLIAVLAGMSAATYYSILRTEFPFQHFAKFFNDHEKAWYYKPLWGCNKCIAGQLGLWSYVLLHNLSVILNDPLTFLFGLFYCICVSILTAVVFTRVFTNIKNKDNEPVI